MNVPAEVDERAGLDVSAEGALGASEYEWSDIYAARGRLDVSEEGAASERERADISAERRSDVSAEGGFDGSERARVAVAEDGRTDVPAQETLDEAQSDVSSEGAIDRAGTEPAPRRRKVCGGEVHRVVLHLAPHLLSDGVVANLDDGTWIAPETWRRVACDCAIDLVKVDESGAVLDVGRRTRTIPPALGRALDVRDVGRCRFPGCAHRRFLDRHHVKHWSDDGETKLDNLLTLCTAHHQLVHEGGWSVDFDGKEARFFQPDGTQLTWPRPPRVDDAVAELEEAHAELEIGATTGLTQWNGKTPEYAWCVATVMSDAKPSDAKPSDAKSTAVPGRERSVARRSEPVTA